MPVKRRVRASAPMSEQDQALAEEEAAKRRGEMLTLFLKDKVAKEERSSTLNLHKLNTQWQAVLREAKDKELRRDIEILSQTFSRVMDCKDGVIESLVMELEEAEEQHARALRSHLQNLDGLLQLQEERMGCLEESYNAQLRALQAEFEAERRTILEQHQRESHHLRALVLAAEQNRAESNQEVTLNFQSARDELKNKSLQEKQYTRLQLGGRVEELWDHFQRALRSYTEASEPQKIAFKALKRKDEKSAREIEMQARRLQKLQDLVAATKGRMAAHLRESEEQTRRAREEKERALRHLQELKIEMNQARVKARGDLVKLTVQSGAALKALKQVVEKARRILRLAEMCRKLETEEEKVLPFYLSSLAKGEQQDAQHILEEPPEEPLARAVWDYVGLEKFWQRFNKVKLEEKALEKEREALSRRNRHLRELLGQYLEGISVSQEVLNKPNSLFIVQHKICVPRDVPHGGRDPA